MPGGEFTIEKRKLRGEVSDGMILSERELELGQDHGGIMLLPDELEPGTPLADVLPVGDDILEIETLYNRPDLTSIYGIAREVAVLTGAELRADAGHRSAARRATSRSTIAIEDLERCPRYVGRLFRDVRIGESPAWLKARLIGAGMRPISNVVDVTNYVMLALGNPLHAFDYDKLAGGRIVVRRARPGEKLETLDGTKRELDPEDLVIADAERPIAIAGVMGGANTEVGDETTYVLLEAANFEPLTVLRSGERHRMRTESQTRWEKGVDPELAGPAATYASQLLAELAGARWTGEAEVRGEIPPPAVIAFRPGYTDRGARARDPGGRAARPPGSGSASRVDADWTRARPRPGAHATFAATSTSSRRSRASGSRTCRLTLPVAAGDVRPAHARPAPAPPGRGRARRRRLLRGVHLLAAAERSRPERDRAAGAAQLAAARCCARRSRSGCSARRAQRRPAATRTSRSSRSRTSICRRTARCPRSGGGSAGSSQRRLLPGEGRRRGGVRRAARRAARSSARSRSPSATVGATRAVGLGRAVRAARAGRRVERVRARPRRALRRGAGADPLPRRDHVPAAAARTSRSSSTRACRPAS